MKNLLIGLFFFVVMFSFSQNSSQQKNDPENHHIQIKPKDSLSLKDYILKAHWEAHTRTFLMSTINEGDLKDDYALGSGAGLGLLTHPLYGFQVGVSGFFIYNLYSSHLEIPDSLSGGINRYEVGLFDVEDPKNKHDLDRLEELYLKYSFSKSNITVGKININTPFINPQDGRMRPTISEGVWLSIGESKKIGFNGGWIWDVSPRSTVKWFTLANSLGTNPMGVNIDGTRSNYKEHVTSSGMAIANVYFRPAKNVKVSIWDGMFENVMNTAMIEINANQKLSDNVEMYEGLMYLHQDAINQGGNNNQSKTYINKGAQSNVISAQIGLRNNNANLSANYTHITGDGRYLMPREWGKEPFYTFLPRERNEGLGNVHAMMVKSSFNLFQNKFKTGIGYGYYLLPDVKDYRLNKYGMPSYHQINADASYSFNKFLKGMDIRALIVYKLNADETYNNYRFVYNKVNMVNFNLILDFKI